MLVEFPDGDKKVAINPDYVGIVMQDGNYCILYMGISGRHNEICIEGKFDEIMAKLNLPT